MLPFRPWLNPLDNNILREGVKKIDRRHIRYQGGGGRQGFDPPPATNFSTKSKTYSACPEYFF